jgi:hypothetical protein
VQELYPIGELARIARRHAPCLFYAHVYTRGRIGNSYRYILIGAADAEGRVYMERVIGSLDVMAAERILGLLWDSAPLLGWAKEWEGPVRILKPPPGVTCSQLEEFLSRSRRLRRNTWRVREILGIICRMLERITPLL